MIREIAFSNLNVPMSAVMSLQETLWYIEAAKLKAVVMNLDRKLSRGKGIKLKLLK